MIASPKFPPSSSAPPPHYGLLFQHAGVRPVVFLAWKCDISFPFQMIAWINAESARWWEGGISLPPLCPTLLKIPDADTPEKSRGGGVLPTKKRELPKNFCAQIAGPCKYTHRFERERESPI
ncbi:hypothetical protein NPIL_375511 [Nephila pilipes]|uniref:Uncharacterized protein n=1 Tax=Nephila pilipes TaxID=299642 RepID=A0A8X6MVL0_NEPPI|nr:hypothetical protein NPIL_375511 [Nephila pilipes]